VATEVWKGKISTFGGSSGQSYCTAPVTPSPVTPTPVPTISAVPTVSTVPTVPTVPTAFLITKCVSTFQLLTVANPIHTSWLLVCRPCKSNALLLTTRQFPPRPPIQVRSPSGISLRSGSNACLTIGFSKCDVLSHRTQCSPRHLWHIGTEMTLTARTFIYGESSLQGSTSTNSTL
jgi:hypothetical protein